MLPLSGLRSAQRVLLPALLLALSLLFAFPAISQAHAILLRSDPARDAVLNTAPTQVRMWFSEELNPTFTTAVVVNAKNQRVDARDAHISSTNTFEMDVNLQPDLPPSVYIVIWRTQSADDGHVLRGSFLFTVALPDGTIPKLNGALPGQDALGGASPGASTGQLDGPTLFNLLMVTLVDLGAVFWVGAQLWRSFVLQLIDPENSAQTTIYRSVEQRFDRMFSLPTLVLLLFANIGVLVGQALYLTGNQWSQAFNPALLSGLVTTGHFGTYWLMRQVVILLAMLLAAYTWLTQQRSALLQNMLSWANLLLALALLIAMALSGHAAAVSSDLLVYSVLVDWLHLLAAALWIGGMMYIAAIYLPILKESVPIERVRSLLTTLSQFSPLAIVAVIIMSISGPFNATVHMSSWDQLFNTVYGRVLIVKVLLVSALLLTSAFHVVILRPRLARNYKHYLSLGTTTPVTLPTYGTPDAEEKISEHAEASSQERPTPVMAQEVKQLETQVTRQAQRLTAVLRWEPWLGIAVLICTALLNVFASTLLPAPPPQPPPTPVKAFTTTVKTSDNKFTVTLTVSPNHFGPNTFTTSVLNSKGQPDTNLGVSLYTTMLDMDMGTETLNLHPDNKGHFSATGDLDMSGRWQIRIQIRTPDDTLHEARVDLFTPF